MFGFLMLLLVGATVWFLWNISRNTADALDKQTALQYEVVALEKRLDDLIDLVKHQQTGTQSLPSQESSAPVDINRADIRELTRLPRIGKAMAQRLIDQRPYANLDELLSVQGFSQELLDALQGRIRV